MVYYLCVLCTVCVVCAATVCILKRVWGLVWSIILRMIARARNIWLIYSLIPPGSEYITVPLHMVPILVSLTLSACARITVVVLCVCVCVCYYTNCYIPRLYVEIKVALSFLCHFLHMHCVDFIENALFRSYGDICWPPLPSLLFWQTFNEQNRQQWLLFKMTSM